jgi:hypothetical protein
MLDGEFCRWRCERWPVVWEERDIGRLSDGTAFAPREIVATIYKGAGLDLDTHLPGPRGAPFLRRFGTKTDQPNYSEDAAAPAATAG